MAGVSTPWGVRLRYALNAPHKPRRRASLRRTPQGRQQIKRKGDTSNEVRKGTFLKRFDKSIPQALTRPHLPPIISRSSNSPHDRRNYLPLPHSGKARRRRDG